MQRWTRRRNEGGRFAILGRSRHGLKPEVTGLSLREQMERHVTGAPPTPDMGMRRARSHVEFVSLFYSDNLQHGSSNAWPGNRRDNCGGN